MEGRTTDHLDVVRRYSVDKCHSAVDLVEFRRSIDKRPAELDSAFRHIRHGDIEYSHPYILIDTKVISSEKIQ